MTGRSPIKLSLFELLFHVHPNGGCVALDYGNDMSTFKFHFAESQDAVHEVQMEYLEVLGRDLHALELDLDSALALQGRAGPAGPPRFPSPSSATSSSP